MPSASTARAIAAVADAAGGGDALAQPDDAGERVDDAEAVAGRPRDQQPAIVGAEIERRIGRAWPAIAGLARMAVRRSPTPRRPPRAAPGHAQGRGPRCPGPRRSCDAFLPRQSPASTGAAMSKSDHRASVTASAPSRNSCTRTAWLRHKSLSSRASSAISGRPCASILSRRIGVRQADGDLQGRCVAAEFERPLGRDIR